MDCKIIWTPRSLANLESITSFIARNNPDAARRMGLTIISATDRLRGFPSLGAVFQKLNRDDVRELAIRPYRVFYHIKDAQREVAIITVWHGSREEPDVRL